MSKQHSRSVVHLKVLQQGNLSHSVDRTIEGVKELLEAASRSEQKFLHGRIYHHRDAWESARNFCAYLGVRQMEIRHLQRDLHRLGITSLGRGETHVRDSLQCAFRLLCLLDNRPQDLPWANVIDYDEGERILAERAAMLLGDKPDRRSARIMITMASDAATDYVSVRDLLAAGMEIMRINFAHDDSESWAAMIGNLRRAERELGKRCAVLCDVAGPKLRTGAVVRSPGVIHWHAFKNEYGEVKETAKIWIPLEPASPASAAAAVLPVNREFIAQAQKGDEIHFHDTQGRRRWITVTDIVANGVWAEAARGAYVTKDIALTMLRGERELPVRGFVQDLPSMPLQITLNVNDLLVITDESVLGEAELSGRPAHIGCTLPEVFEKAKKGERIFFDDGKIAGVIEDVRRDARQIDVRITWKRSPKTTLTEGKGINLPDTSLDIAALSAKDCEDLEFAKKHARDIDMISLSFVRGANDVRALYRMIEDFDFGVILKIETQWGFKNLPEIVLAALQRNKVGVMIARGDLGVEVGFERMAELQEEILSLCSAAHLPVVWATQVLENLAKKGMPSRAEVSDVVMAARSQCVMLNKGPHIGAAVKFLTDVLERMEGHQDKSFRLMRALEVARGNHGAL